MTRDRMTDDDLMKLGRAEFGAEIKRRVESVLTDAVQLMVSLDHYNRTHPDAPIDFDPLEGMPEEFATEARRRYAALGKQAAS